MAILLERAAYSDNCMFSFYYVYFPHIGFESGTVVQISPVKCLPFISEVNIMICQREKVMFT